MFQTRILDAGSKPVSLNVREGATLQEALDAAGVTRDPAKALAQNGRPAEVGDVVKANSVVQQMPKALHA